MSTQPEILTIDQAVSILQKEFPGRSGFSRPNLYIQIRLGKIKGGKYPPFSIIAIPKDEVDRIIRETKAKIKNGKKK